MAGLIVPSRYPTPELLNLPVPALNHFIAVDTETTGLNWRVTRANPIPANVFMVITCDQSGTTRCYEWIIHPDTRDYHFDDSQERKEWRDQVHELYNYLSTFPYMVMHNSPFDRRGLHRLFSRAGIPLKKIEKLLDRKNIYDTIPASHIHSSSREHGLKPCAAMYCNIPEDDEQDLKDEVTRAHRAAKSLGYATGDVAADYWLPAFLEKYHPRSGFTGQKARTYGVTDSVRQAHLWIFYASGFNQDLKQTGGHLWGQYLLEHQILQPFNDMEDYGISLSRKRLDEAIKAAASHKDFSLAEMRRLTGLPDFNPDSHKQLPHLLFHTLGFPVEKLTAAGNPSADKEVLFELFTKYCVEPKGKVAKAFAGLVSPILQNLRDYKKYGTTHKMLISLSNYGLEDEDGNFWIYPNWRSNGTRLTRATTSSPNSQNVKKHDPEEVTEDETDVFLIRETFSPRVRKMASTYKKTAIWVGIDYDQIEARIFAYVSQDERLLTCFANNEDFHQITADALSLPRSGTVHSGKHINFAWLYGGGDKKLAWMAQRDSAFEFIMAMGAVYGGAVEHKNTMTTYARKNKRIVCPFGYPIDVPGNKAHAAVNAQVQGAAGEVAKNAIRMLYFYIQNARFHGHKLSSVCRIINFIHDEIVFEISKSLTVPQQGELSINLAHLMSLAGSFLGWVLPTKIEVSHTDWKHSDVWYQITPTKIPTRACYPTSLRDIQTALAAPKIITEPSKFDRVGYFKRVPQPLELQVSQ